MAGRVWDGGERFPTTTNDYLASKVLSERAASLEPGIGGLTQAALVALVATVRVSHVKGSFLVN